MTRHATSIRLHRLTPTPYTLHADWRPDTPASSTNQKQMLEITSSHQNPLSICVEQHRCTSRPLPPETVMVTTSTCTILHVGAGDEVHVAPITLHKVLVKEEVQIPQNASAPAMIISSTLANLLSISSQNSSDLVLCPKSYTATRQNMRVHITDVRDEVQPATSPGALCVWLRPDVIAALDLQANGEVSLYQPPLTTNIAVRVLQHPGFCYLSSHDATSVNIPNETIIELHARKSIKSYIQVHPLLEDTHESSIDFSLADALHIDTHKLTFIPVHAQLYWIRKEPVDDIRNKARAVVCLPQETLTQGGYNPQEPVSVFYEGKAHTATIEPIIKPLPEGTLVATPLFLRKAKLSPGQGVFLNTDHIPFAVAKVGILNIEELGDNSARGSSQLASSFPMPCWVELQNPARGTSLDILLKQDPYPRQSTLVRLARTTRQMLLLERGDEVLVRPIMRAKNPRPLRTFLAHIVGIPCYQLLLLLIGRRRILVSLAPAHTWDDQAQVARADKEALTVLGISEGDRIRIMYRGRGISRHALSRDADYKDPISMPEARDAVYNILPVQFQIGLDALGRHELSDGAIEFGTVVEVERDMVFILFKSLNLALLPVIGTVLTILTLFSKESLLVQIILAIQLSCLFFYLALSVERAKVV